MQSFSGLLRDLSKTTRPKRSQALRTTISASIAPKCHATDLGISPAAALGTPLSVPFSQSLYVLRPSNLSSFWSAIRILLWGQVKEFPIPIPF